MCGIIIFKMMKIKLNYIYYRIFMKYNIKKFDKYNLNVVLIQPICGIWGSGQAVVNTFYF